MIEPAIPSNETERMAALVALQLLDTPAEERFDRITRLACRIFDVPMAALTLVDSDRQWFKSTEGMEVQQTSRRISFCGHVVQQGELLLVPDTTLDPRFADNPLVTGEPHIRFYAGQPLSAPDGSHVGVLCIIDRHPRELSAGDLEILRDLAGWVESELQVVRMSHVQQELIAELDATRRRAMLDPLTRLWNRQGITEVLERQLARAGRERLPLGVLLADIDHFKGVNDLHGHGAGDAVLRESARRMRGSLRPYDAIGRYGGDEFLIVIEDCDWPKAARIAEKIRTRISGAEMEVGEARLQLSVSLGVVLHHPSMNGDVAAMIELADRALYLAKRNGRDRVELALG